MFEIFVYFRMVYHIDFSKFGNFCTKKERIKMFLKHAIAIFPVCLRWTVHRSSGDNAFEDSAALMLFSVSRELKLIMPSRLSFRAFHSGSLMFISCEISI